MKRTRLLGVLLLASTPFCSACDSGDGAEPASSGSVQCVAGAQLQCACVGGGTGISLCPASGYLTGACEGCPAESTNPDPGPAGGTTTPSLVSVDFSLFDGDKFPTYLAHLYGQDIGSETLHYVDVMVQNPGTTAAALTIEAELQGYSFTAIESVTVPPGQTESFLVDVTFDYGAQYSISAPVSSAATVRLYESGGTGQPVDTWTETITVVPKNTVFWVTEDEDEQLVDIRGLVATLVTPHDAAGEVDKLLTDAAKESAFGVMYGYSLFDAGKSLVWTAEVGPGNCAQWPAFYRSGQAIAVDVDVTCFPCLDYNASYVLQDDSGSEVLRVDGLGEWQGTAQVPADGWYTHFACNPSSNGSNRTFTLERSIGANDAALDQLTAIYSALQARGMVYTNVPASYFDYSQNVKTPAESLISGSENCIDGSLVFAAALEAIGMRPGIAFVPGHAFVAVRIQADPTSGWLPIETTMVSTSSSANALAVGLEKWNAALSAGTLAVFDIHDLREAGISPAPM